MIKYAACILLVSAAMISSVRANDPPISSDLGEDLYQLPNLSFSTTEPSGISGDEYAALCAQITTPTEGTIQDEWLIPFDPASGPPDIDFTNDLSESLTLSDVGFQLSLTQIPLDDLNLNNNTPLPSLDGAVLTPGESSADVSLTTPEPASIEFAIMVCALLGVLIARRRCRLE